MKNRQYVISALMAVAVLLIASSRLGAQAKPACYVVDNSGTRIPGVSITAEENGDLVLQPDASGKIKRPFKAGSYRYAFVPKPAEVGELEKLVEAKNHADIIKAAPAAFRKYRSLGWSYAITAIHVEALLAEDKVNEAKRVFQEGARFPGEFREKMENAEIRILVASKDYDRAEDRLKKQMLNADEAVAAQAFCLRGLVAEARGDKKQAILEYMKPLMLFDAKKGGEYRSEAKKHAVRLMKELNDPRVGKIESYE